MEGSFKLPTLVRKQKKDLGLLSTVAFFDVRVGTEKLNLYKLYIQVINNLTNTHQIIHEVVCYPFIPLVISLVKVKRI